MRPAPSHCDEAQRAITRELVRVTLGRGVQRRELLVVTVNRKPEKPRRRRS